MGGWFETVEGVCLNVHTIINLMLIGIGPLSVRGNWPLATECRRGVVETHNKNK